MQNTNYNVTVTDNKVTKKVHVVNNKKLEKPQIVKEAASTNEGEAPAENDGKKFKKQNRQRREGYPLREILDAKSLAVLDAFAKAAQ